jgi:hypothetical protein
METRVSFLDAGFVNFGPVVDPVACRDFLAELKRRRSFGPELFLTEAEFRANPIRKGVNPEPGRNILEGMDLGFVEDNFALKEYIRTVLGPVTITMLKKVVAAIPSEWIPDWVHFEIKEAPVPNLGAFVRPEFRDITYFHGIDWHPDRESDFVTLYVYLDEVGPADSPLYVLPKSHGLGATVFPHKLRKIGAEWHYQDRRGDRLWLTDERLTGPAGSAYLWHACTLHGTQPSYDDKEANRISLRYLIAKPGKTTYLLDVVNAHIKGPLSLAKTRLDLDDKGAVVITGNAINRGT